MRQDSRCSSRIGQAQPVGETLTRIGTQVPNQPAARTSVAFDVAPLVRVRYDGALKPHIGTFGLGQVVIGIGHSPFFATSIETRVSGWKSLKQAERRIRAVRDGHLQAMLNFRHT